MKLELAIGKRLKTIVYKKIESLKLRLILEFV